MTSSMTWCIACGGDFPVETGADEHIIPNALGGRITTKKSLCRSCNSKLGDSLDAAYVRKLAPIANMLDVVRGRGSNKDVITNLKDGSGVRVRQRAGKFPEFDTNLRFKRDAGGKLEEVHLIVSGEYEVAIQQATSAIRTQLPGLQFGQMKLNKMEQNATLNFSTPGFKHKDDLRAPVKIMLNYAKYVGALIKRDCRLVQFFRDDPSGWPLICGPDRDIVKFANNKPHECCHTISIYNPNRERYAYCYLDLFSHMEYLAVVELDQSLEQDSYNYKYDLISATFVSDYCWWDHNALDANKAIYAAPVPYDRMIARCNESICYWYDHRSEIWITRALARGERQFRHSVIQGKNIEDAKQVTESEIRRCLKVKGLDLGSISFDVTTQTDGT